MYNYQTISYLVNSFLEAHRVIFECKCLMKTKGTYHCKLFVRRFHDKRQYFQYKSVFYILEFNDGIENSILKVKIIILTTDL